MWVTWLTWLTIDTWLMCLTHDWLTNDTFGKQWIHDTWLMLLACVQHVTDVIDMWLHVSNRWHTWSRDQHVCDTWLEHGWHVTHDCHMIAHDWRDWHICDMSLTWLEHDTSPTRDMRFTQSTRDCHMNTCVTCESTWHGAWLTLNQHVTDT